MILVLSGCRADYGYLKPVADALGAELQSLEAVLGAGDTPREIAEQAGSIMGDVASMLAAKEPDLLVVLGDRWEILAAAQAAVLAGVPIAHIGAGEETRGSYDDKFRSAIEALASLKFALTQRAYARIGGDGYLAGVTSVRPPQAILPADGTAIIALYPETAGGNLLTGNDLAQVAMAHGLKPLVIGSNPDVDASLFPGVSLPLEEFQARLASASVIMGNSSAGIIEAPILGTPTVNIGTRQEGRPQAASIFNAAQDLQEVEAALIKALAYGKSRADSPYWREGALETIRRECLAYVSRG